MISGAVSGRGSNKSANTSHNKENYGDFQVVQKENIHKNKNKVQSSKPQVTTAVKQNKRTGLKLNDNNSTPTQVTREQRNKRRRQSTVILLLRFLFVQLC